MTTRALPGWLKGFETFLSRSLSWTSAAFFAVAAVLYFTQLIMRYFNQSFLWIDPLVQYLFVLAALMGAAYAVLFNENIKIELFRKLAEQTWVQRVISASGFIISLLLIYVFYKHLLFTLDPMNSGESAFAVPEWILALPYLYLFSASAVFYLLRAFFPAVYAEPVEEAS